LEIDYRFQPGDDDDGLTISVPKEGLQQLDARRLEWLVPGRVEEKLTALIRSLPKALRRSFIPAPDVARQAVGMMPFAEGDFLVIAAQTLSRIGGEPLEASDFRLEKLPHHLRMNVRVVDEGGQPIAEGRDIVALATEVGVEGPSGTHLVSDENWDRKNITTWDFGELPASVTIRRGDFVLQAFPMLQDDGDSVSLGLATTAAAANVQTHAGLRRLFCLLEHRELKSQVHWLPLIDESQVYASTMRHARDLREQLMDLAAELAFMRDQPLPRDEESFKAARDRGRQQLLFASQKLGKLIAPLLQHYHEAEVALGDITSSTLREAVTDMRQQISRLTPEGFWCLTPWNWLTEYSRYFRAITARLEKLQSGGGTRDHQAMQELSFHQERYDNRVALGNLYEESRDSLETYRWMLEEYRVSLFAQQLGTSIKISPQRLDKQWSKL
jgi:ATP-dependent helicase HrpA